MKKIIIPLFVLFFITSLFSCNESDNNTLLKFHIDSNSDLTKMGLKGKVKTHLQYLLRFNNQPLDSVSISFVDKPHLRSSIVSHSFDEYGNLLEQAYLSGKYSSEKDPICFQNIYENNLKTEERWIDSSGEIHTRTIYTYNLDNSLSKEEYFDYNYASSNYEINYSYNKMDTTLSHRSADNCYSYTKVKHHDPTGKLKHYYTLDSDNKRIDQTSSFFNKDGLIIKKTTNTGGAVTDYSYNQTGKLIKQLCKDSKGWFKNEWNEYDAKGNLVYTLSNGSEKEGNYKSFFEYDSLKNCISQKEYSLNNSSLTFQKKMKYDKVGNCVVSESYLVEYGETYYWINTFTYYE